MLVYSLKLKTKFSVLRFGSNHIFLKQICICVFFLAKIRKKKYYNLVIRRDVKDKYKYLKIVTAVSFENHGYKRYHVGKKVLNRPESK